MTDSASGPRKYLASLYVSLIIVISLPPPLDFNQMLTSQRDQNSGFWKNMVILNDLRKLKIKKARHLLLGKYKKPQNIKMLFKF